MERSTDQKDDSSLSVKTERNFDPAMPRAQLKKDEQKVENAKKQDDR